MPQKLHADAWLQDRCIIAYSPREKTNIIDCSDKATGIFVSDIPIDEDIRWTDYLAQIAREGRRLPLADTEQATIRGSLTALLQACLNESCAVDPSVSKADVADMLDTLSSHEIEAWHVRNFSNTLLRVPRGEFRLFHLPQAKLKVSFAYDAESPFNRVSSFSFFDIFIWRD